VWASTVAIKLIKQGSRQYPQPWHASSTLVHEAGIGRSLASLPSTAHACTAVAHLKPDRFWDFSHALFDEQEHYYDAPTATQTPEQLRKKLAGLANEAVGIDAADFLDQVTVGKGNGGNKTTTDLKLAIRCACRLLRGELAHEKAQMDDRTRSTSLPPSSSTA
jgi:hypothetical protein